MAALNGYFGRVESQISAGKIRDINALLAKNTPTVVRSLMTKDAKLFEDNYRKRVANDELSRRYKKFHETGISAKRSDYAASVNLQLVTETPEDIALRNLKRFTTENMGTIKQFLTVRGISPPLAGDFVALCNYNAEVSREAKLLMKQQGGDMAYFESMQNEKWDHALRCLPDLDRKNLTREEFATMLCEPFRKAGTKPTPIQMKQIADMVDRAIPTKESAWNKQHDPTRTQSPTPIKLA